MNGLDVLRMVQHNLQSAVAMHNVLTIVVGEDEVPRYEAEARRMAKETAWTLAAAREELTERVLRGWRLPAEAVRPRTTTRK